MIEIIVNEADDEADVSQSAPLAKEAPAAAVSSRAAPLANEAAAAAAALPTRTAPPIDEADDEADVPIRTAPLAGASQNKGAS